MRLSLVDKLPAIKRTLWKCHDWRCSQHDRRIPVLCLCLTGSRRSQWNTYVVVSSRIGDNTILGLLRPFTLMIVLVVSSTKSLLSEVIDLSGWEECQ